MTRSGPREPFFNFWAPIHVVGIVESRHFTFDTEIGGGEYYTRMRDRLQTTVFKFCTRIGHIKC